ncbi:efflux RND transporter periplasmic adaptor subunit [Rivularia sp. UHCC 0363]|uniref:efflux RND transporter periplasmic adaptor subunit n=1 Tax=Rivularia sp. UHCC 0363 TaxID=3110244 RepID=UPI002B1EE513|nr:efflux RND transporter periplasmic adaptor subunit [Rivularia sp. UHCC 0363]MEA5597490.1 efflux RND transporter periplasmic adaptor subunit [Rivularia sp. UHCC 0363]
MATPIEIPVIGKVKRFPRWLIALFATGVIVVGATTTYTFVNRANNKQDITELTVPVQEKNVTLLLNASGKIVPVQNVNISPKNPGTVTQLYVEQGDTVKQGQILARMDSADIQARILQARANLAQAQAKLDQAKAGSRPQEISQAKARLAQAQAQLAAATSGNRPQEIAASQAQVDAAKAKVDLTNERVRRYRSLYSQGAIKKDDLDQFVSEDKTAQANLLEAQKRLALLKSGSRSEEIARLQAAVAEARAQLQLLESGSRPEEIAQAAAGVRAAQAQFQTEQVNLDNTIIRAPFSGIITQKFANIGAFVTPTTSASSSASATSSSVVALARGLEVLANVPEADISKIKVGQQVDIVADAYPDQVFKGEVRLIAPEAVNEQGVTLFQIRVAINTGKDELLSGLNVNLTFLGDDVKALWVPTVTIVTEKGQTGVLVPDKNNKAEFSQVTIGSQVGNETQVLEGLQIGDRIFTSPPTDYKIQKKLEKSSE